MPDRCKRPRRYAVRIEGFDAEYLTAASAGAARYATFKAYREAGYRATFRDFLRKTTTLCLGVSYV
jgi:hypothetical protein